MSVRPDVKPPVHTAPVCRDPDCELPTVRHWHDEDKKTTTFPIKGEGFVTKDSGKRAAFANGGVRDTQEGKPRFDLMFPKTVPYEHQMLTRFAALLARGAEKYADRNWEQFSDADALERAKGSAMRHAVQWLTGERDEDHAAATYFNIMAAEYVEGVMNGLWSALPAPEHTQVLQAIERLEMP